MPTLLRQMLWALLYAVLSLPVAYVITTILLSWAHRGYVRVDPARLRRISLACSLGVFVAAILVQRWR